MTPLRQRMSEDMQVRNLAPHTQRSYLQQVSQFARHFGKSPDLLGPDDIRAYQLHLTQEKQLSASSVLVAVAAKVRGTRLGNPRLPATGTLAPARTPATPGGRTRAAAAQARAVAAYGPVIEKARAEGARSLGDYAQALQAARLPAPQGGDRWSRPSVARVLRYCKEITALKDQGPAA